MQWCLCHFDWLLYSNCSISWTTFLKCDRLNNLYFHKSSPFRRRLTHNIPIPSTIYRPHRSIIQPFIIHYSRFSFTISSASTRSISLSSNHGLRAYPNTSNMSYDLSFAGHDIMYKIYTIRPNLMNQSRTRIPPFIFVIVRYLLTDSNPRAREPFFNSTIKIIRQFRVWRIGWLCTSVS